MARRWIERSRRPAAHRPGVDVSTQIADALDAAHSEGILHRDVKPGNVFITRRGQVKVVDFGLAKMMQRVGSIPSATVTMGNPHLSTSAGIAVGTVAYMSPEHARGEALDARSDLFSLGIVMYQMATGVQTFKGQTTAVVFDQILNRVPAPPSLLNPNVPLSLEHVIGRLLEKDRGLRYQTARDLHSELQRLRRDLESRRFVLNDGQAVSVASAWAHHSGPHAHPRRRKQRPPAQPRSRSSRGRAHAAAAGAFRRSSHGVRPTADVRGACSGARCAPPGSHVERAGDGAQAMGPASTPYVESVVAPPPMSAPSPIAVPVAERAAPEGCSCDRAVAAHAAGRVVAHHRRPRRRARRPRGDGAHDLSEPEKRTHQRRRGGRPRNSRPGCRDDERGALAGAASGDCHSPAIARAASRVHGSRVGAIARASASRGRSTRKGPGSVARGPHHHDANQRHDAKHHRDVKWNQRACLYTAEPCAAIASHLARHSASRSGRARRGRENTDSRRAPKPKGSSRSRPWRTRMPRHQRPATRWRSSRRHIRTRAGSPRPSARGRISDAVAAQASAPARD